MLRPLDLIRHAGWLVTVATPDEANHRRAVSAAYYALFHMLTQSGADLFGVGANDGLHGLIARSFEHRPMKKVCEAYRTPTSQQFTKLHAPLLPLKPDLRLFAVADAFCLLQEARHTADYDLLTAISRNDAYSDVFVAVRAVRDWQAISATPEARIFLTALLLADRWTRRG